MFNLILDHIVCVIKIGLISTIIITVFGQQNSAYVHTKFGDVQLYILNLVIHKEFICVYKIV